MATTDKKQTINEEALAAIIKALGAKGGDFSQKAEASLDLLDAALDFFAAQGVLVRASVEVQIERGEGGHYVRKYSLATRWEYGKEVAFLQKSEATRNE